MAMCWPAHRLYMCGPLGTGLTFPRSPGPLARMYAPHTNTHPRLHACPFAFGLPGTRGPLWQNGLHTYIDVMKSMYKLPLHWAAATSHHEAGAARPSHSHVRPMLATTR